MDMNVTSCLVPRDGTKDWIVNDATNGIDLGHVQRLLAVSRWLTPSDRVGVNQSRNLFSDFERSRGFTLSGTVCVLSFPGDVGGRCALSLYI